MERIHMGPGRLYGPDGNTLLEIKEASFDGITTIAEPGPAGDVRVYTPSFLEPIELSMEIRADRRLVAALVVGWRAPGPVRWKQLDRARRLAKNKKNRPRAEVQ
ncbi:MAG: hypothetical protein IJG86_01840 [Clostridia bacterium]|nr:hypothetical protein [Clostridia bacterium]